MKKYTEKLTKREYKLYFAIKDFIEKYNYSPSYRELIDMGIYKSLSSINDTLLKFEKLGYIKVGKAESGKIKSRTIRVIYTNEIRKKLDKIGEIFNE